MCQNSLPPRLQRRRLLSTSDKKWIVTYAISLKQKGLAERESLSAVALLILDDFGMRKLPQTAAEDLLEIVMRSYERASTLLTSNRPVED